MRAHQARKPASRNRIAPGGLPATRTEQRGILARRMLGVGMKFGADNEICGEGEPVEYVYEVGSGAVRTVKILADGRRKIGGFYFSGDIFGLEEGDDHTLSAEAVVSATVHVIKRRTLVELAAGDRTLANELLAMAMRDVARAHHHALMLIMTAQERVNSFLVEMGQRISVGDLVQLPMSRQDIADYLGLTIETVSRSFTGLADTSTIKRPARRTIMLHNRSALEQGSGAGSPSGP
jgi:CRP/FNR family transcriptional regulator, nitrogen fixation regulation protein